MAETVHNIDCDRCGKLMYRATASAVKYTPGLSNTPPIQLTIGCRIYLLCSRDGAVRVVEGMTEDALRAGTGYRLPWGWPSGGEEKPVGEG